MIYTTASETEVVAFAIADGVYTSLSGLQQSQHPTILPLRRD
jgi:hypothetical protein